LAAAWSGGKAGFIDTRGRFVIEPQFDSAGSFVDDRAPVLSNMHVGFIDKSGNVAIELKYSDSAPFQEGLAPVKDNTNWGFVDPDGKLAIPATFEDVGSFTEGLARAKSDGKWGYIDKTGAWVIQPQYSEAESASPPVLHFREGLAAVYADGNWKFIDKAGTQVFEGVFHKAGEFSEGLCPVVVNVATKAGETDYRLGFIDTTGRMVIAPQFYAGVTLTNQLVVGFHSGLSPVKEVTGSGLWGYINEDGKFVIEPTASCGVRSPWLYWTIRKSVSISRATSCSAVKGSRAVPTTLRQRLRLPRRSLVRPRRFPKRPPRFLRHRPRPRGRRRAFPRVRRGSHIWVGE
jgi:hypothetical protein